MAQTTAPPFGSGPDLLASALCLFARSTPDRKQEIAIAVDYPHDPNGVGMDLIQQAIAAHQNLTNLWVIELKHNSATFRQLGQ
jgi:hypothetical protein